MKEFLLSTTLPYWVVFALMVAAAVLSILEMRKESISKSSAQLVTLLAVGGTVLGLVIYAVLGGNSIWWCTSSDYSFFGKLFRVIPLIVFVAIQLAQVFVYKMFMEQYYQKDLSIKGSFLSLIVVVPVSLVLYILLDIFGLEQGTRDVVFYLILGVALVAGVGWAMARNVRSVGSKQGMLFTAVTLVMIIGGLMSLLLLIIALISLIVQVLMVAAIVGAFLYLFKTNMLGTGGGSSGGTKVFYDNEGHMHYTNLSKENANQKIQEGKNNN